MRKLTNSQLRDSKTPPSTSANLEEVVLTISRNLEVLVRLKMIELRGTRTMSEMILLLHQMGLRPVQIAQALGKSDNDVNPVISRAKRVSNKSLRKTK
jgi:hypothetical protein